MVKESHKHCNALYALGLRTKTCQPSKALILSNKARLLQRIQRLIRIDNNFWERDGIGEYDIDNTVHPFVTTSASDFDPLKMFTIKRHVCFLRLQVVPLVAPTRSSSRTETSFFKTGERLRK